MEPAEHSNPMYLKQKHKKLGTPWILQKKSQLPMDMFTLKTRVRKPPAPVTVCLSDE